ncbi:hypothetical protein SAMN04487849_10513 [Micrococcus luteus]|uniref:Uncharacterized protein n=1 Tax=Micrococcus luteus TaxID=1270 RepID=A0ABD7M7C4_MICLU|nr:hypothetical protein SAMN04487849_10513 [Micrococcus luteus]
MVATDSRAAALRYKHAMDAYLAKRVGVPGYGWGALVAFSGEVEDPAAPDEMLTERAANPGVHADLTSHDSTLTGAGCEWRRGRAELRRAAGHSRLGCV